jgi:hypothetical protein
MANVCKNTLAVTGPAEDISRFRELGSDPSVNTDLSLGKFCPVPDNQPDGGYRWCIENWGCRSDIHAFLKVDAEDYLEYDFESPWSPPVPWLKPVSSMFPALEFRLKYDEPGMGFMGVAKAHEGFVDDDSLSYS